MTEPLPAVAVKALHEGVDDLATRERFQGYGPATGHEFVRKAIAQCEFRDRGVQVADDEIFLSDGSKPDASNFLEILGSGNRIAVPDPVYPVYVDTNVMAGNTGVALEGGRYEGLLYMEGTPANGFVPQPPSERMDVVYLCFPNNPTGATITRAGLKSWVDWARANDAIILFDAAYEAYVRSDDVPRSIFEIDGAREVAIEFHSLSKTYNMTGWRCGWAVAKPEIATALAKVKAFTDTGQYMGIQAAGVAAIESWAEFVPQNVAVFQSRRDAAVAAFRAHGFAADVPRATMYLWMPLPEGIASAAFADRLREDAGVIVLPGSGFGAGGEGFFRISFIQSEARIAVAAQRAGAVLNAMLKELA